MTNGHIADDHVLVDLHAHFVNGLCGLGLHFFIIERIQPGAEHLGNDVLLLGLTIEQNVFRGSKAGDQRELLMHHADTGLQCIKGCIKGDFFTNDEDVAAVAAGFPDDVHTEKDINGDKFDHYNKRRFFSYTKQYVRTGENSFTKIQRSLAVIIIPILLVTSMLVGLTFIPSKPDKPHMPWTPVIEDTTGNSDNNGEEQRPAGIQVKGFTEWTIPANKTEGLGIDLENPDGNPCYFSFEIKLKDSGEVIYKSSMVPPGEKIHKIDISREFSQGDYPIIIHIYTNELETGAEMNSPEMQVTMHVK